MNINEVKDKISGHKEVGILSSLIILTQIITSTMSSNNLSSEMDSVKNEISKLRLERAEYFVTKKDFDSLSDKVNHISTQIADLNVQAASIKTFLRSRLNYSTTLTCNRFASYQEMITDYFLLVGGYETGRTNRAHKKNSI